MTQNALEYDEKLAGVSGCWEACLLFFVARWVEESSSCRFRLWFPLFHPLPLSDQPAMGD